MDGNNKDKQQLVSLILPVQVSAKHTILRGKAISVDIRRRVGSAHQSEEGYKIISTKNFNFISPL